MAPWGLQFLPPEKERGILCSVFHLLSHTRPLSLLTFLHSNCLFSPPSKPLHPFCPFLLPYLLIPPLLFSSASDPHLWYLLSSEIRICQSPWVSPGLCVKGGQFESVGVSLPEESDSSLDCRTTQIFRFWSASLALPGVLKCGRYQIFPFLSEVSGFGWSSLCAFPLLHVFSDLLLSFLIYLSPPRYIFFPPSPFLLLSPSSPTPSSHCLPPSPLPSHPYPQSHLISLQSVWLIYHCCEILKSLLPPVLRGVHDFYLQHTHTYTLNLNHNVSWRLSAAVHFGQTAHFLLVLVDWQAPLGNCRCLYAVRKTADT